MRRLLRYGVIGRLALLLVTVVGVNLMPAMGQPTNAAPPSPPPYEDGVVLVGFHGGVSDDDEDSVEREEGAVRVRSLGSGTHVLQVSKGQVDAKIEALRRRPEVRYAEPNYQLHAIGTPNDPSYSQLWGLDNTGQTVSGTSGTSGADIKAEEAWAVTTGSNSVVVGVVDSGIDYTHPDLAANIWNNPGGVGGCAAGTHGYNAVTRTCDPKDDNNHGSHVSGTIGGVGNNGVGVVGVNWTTSIMGLKFLNAAGSGFTSDAIAAIEFAVQAKIAGVNVRVLNNSWGGGGFSQALLDEINKAGANGILFVAAAGNSSANVDGAASYPCRYTAANLVCVAATDQNDGLAWFSNYGSASVDLGAPGTNIMSTIAGGGYAYYQGTSMATPHVTGAAALVLSAPGQGSLTVGQLKSAILNNVDPVPSLAGKTLTGGRLNVCKAIPGCGAITIPTVPGTPALSATAGNATVHLTWTAPSTGGSAVTNYNVYRGTASGGETALATTGAGTSYDDNAANNGTKYYYQVSAVNAVGEGARSNEVSATPQAVSAPTAPRNLTAKRASNRGVNLSWTAPSSNGGSAITGYRIYRSTSSNTETILVSIGNITSYRDTATKNGVTYFYKVTAVNSVGESLPSNEASARAR